MKVSRVAVALAGALALQLLLTGFTSLFIGEGGAYGAPVSVGSSCGFCITSLGGTEPTFSWPAFTLNVVLTGGVFWALQRLGGHGFLVPFGAAIFLVIAGVTYAGLDAGIPFAGLPLPVATQTGQRMALVVLWIDCMIGAGLFAASGIVRTADREGRRPRFGPVGRGG